MGGTASRGGKNHGKNRGKRGKHGKSGEKAGNKRGRSRNPLQANDLCETAEKYCNLICAKGEAWRGRSTGAVIRGRNIS